MKCGIACYQSSSRYVRITYHTVCGKAKIEQLLWAQYPIKVLTVIEPFSVHLVTTDSSDKLYNCLRISKDTIKRMGFLRLDYIDFLKTTLTSLTDFSNLPYTGRLKG
jgi:hypothetical protein